MPRPKRFRKIQNPPQVAGFVPIDANYKFSEPVLLCYEEYEAIRLVDYEGGSHSEAAACMEVSRPTFTRVYNKARKAIAKAFVLGHPLFFYGGTFDADDLWYSCNDCNNHFLGNKQAGQIHCADCGSTVVAPVAGRKKGFFCNFCQKQVNGHNNVTTLNCENCQLKK